MNRRQLFCALVLFVFSLSGTILFSQSNPGLIRGTVLDEAGQPLVNARIDAELQQTLGGVASRHYSQADENGEFTVADLPLGKYDIYVSKEDRGYPDLHFSLYDVQVGNAELSYSEPLASVVLKTGPLAGIVHANVVDAKTAAPVRATFTLRRTEDASHGLSTSDHRLLLPPGKEVTLEISAQGYKPWTYADPSNPSQPVPLRLESGQEAELTAVLEPVEN